MARILTDQNLCELCHLRWAAVIVDKHICCARCAQAYLARLEQERWRV